MLYDTTCDLRQFIYFRYGLLIFCFKIVKVIFCTILNLRGKLSKSDSVLDALNHFHHGRTIMIKQ